MRVALTLIAGAAGYRLPGLAASVSEALSDRDRAGLAGTGQACDFILDASDPGRSAGPRVSPSATPRSISWSSRRRVGASGCSSPISNSTIIENEMLDELGAILGIGSHVAEITRRAMNGEIDFAAALKARVALLAGTRRICSTRRPRGFVCAGSRSLIATMRRDGVTTALVTGGFTVFADRVARRTRFRPRRRQSTGDRRGPPDRQGAAPDRNRRNQARDAVGARRRARDPADTDPRRRRRRQRYADAECRRLGVAFRAKPAVAAAARWRLDHADLTGLLYAQGYRKTEFAL